MATASNIVGLKTEITAFDEITIADYQRNYNWKSENIKALWDDLREVIDEKSTHFLGSLILQQDSDDPKKAEVVDGQQRLTTIFLLMARLRDEVRRLGVKSIQPRDGQHREIFVLSLIEGFLYRGSTVLSRYTPNSLIADLFTVAMTQEDIEAGGYLPIPRRSEAIPRRDRSSLRLITVDFRNAYWQIKDLVEKELALFQSEEDKLIALHLLATAVSESLQILPITTSSTSESLDVFMTINNRGLELGVFDLVRGQILTETTKGLPNDARLAKFEKVHDEWNQILQNLAGSSPDRFLRHFLLSIQSKKVTAKTVTLTAFNLIQKGSRSPHIEADELWGKIIHGSAVYSELQSPSNPSSKYATLLHALNIVSDSYRVLLLRILDPAVALTEQQLEQIVPLVFRVAFAWPMQSKNAQDLESEFQRIAQKTKSEDDLASVTIALEALLPKDFDSLDFFSSSVSATWAKALLMVLDSDMSGRAAFLIPEMFEVEHVAPQKENDDWRETLALTGEEYKEIIEKVGNLTLLDKGINKQIKQNNFRPLRAGDKDKISEYDRSRSHLTKDLVSLPEWSVDIIEQRNQWFVEQINAIILKGMKQTLKFSDWRESKK